MQKILFNYKSTKRIIAISALTFLVFSLMGCHRNKKIQKINTYSHQEAEINELKIRITVLEEVIKRNSSSKPTKTIQKSINPIKSITFRMGSNDDRIRIYWEDGRKTDMPCTKEQSIWACG